MLGDNVQTNSELRNDVVTDDEGGLRAPPHLHGWRKAWWWFDFIVLVKLARLRFIAILAIIGLIITQWDTLTAYYDKWTRPTIAAQAGSANIEYFCPMHPTIVRDNPKEKCPICFMPLSKRKKGSAEPEVLPAGTVNRVQLTPYRVVLAGIQTWPVDYQELSKEITAVGFVEFNERGQRTVSSRFAGRIEQLYANETGQMVKKGESLALLYSPDLMVTVQNLTNANKSGNQDLLAGARARLELLGIDNQQIDEFLQAGRATTEIAIRSPIGGHVITKYVKEGQYVEEGSPLFEVADLATVWIQAQIYEDELAFLPIELGHGQSSEVDGIEVSARTRAYPAEVFKGTLTFAYPHVDEATRTVTVRFELANPLNKLRPGTTASVTLKVTPKTLPIFSELSQDPESSQMLNEGRVLAVPESSVIDTGNQKIVYREASSGVYEGTLVTLAPKMTTPDGAVFYPVISGLSHGDAVVTSGSFLVDAETRLNPAAGSIYFGGSGGSKAKQASVVRPTTPEDPEAKIKSALAKLTPDDRTLAESQRFCPVLPTSRLGSMGIPLKLTVDGETVFVCCSGCRKKALSDPSETLATVKKLRDIPRETE
jgi:membrane fusion protein, copper/silver efflux system